MSNNESNDFECPDCGSTFKSGPALNSHRGQMHDPKVEVECQHCGEIRRIQPHKQERWRFCSMDCKADWQSENRVGEDSPSWDGGHTVTIQCDWCGESDEKVHTTVEKYNHNFCSNACRDEWRKDRIQENCTNCDTVVLRRRSKIERSDNVFCSESCQVEWRKGRFEGEDNPHWKGGHEGSYGSSWERQRKAAIKRDGYKCRYCGVSNSEHIEAHNRALHVHHIHPFREYGLENHEQANRLSNLVTLCFSCHAKWEGIPLAPQ